MKGPPAPVGDTADGRPRGAVLGEKRANAQSPPHQGLRAQRSLIPPGVFATVGATPSELRIGPRSRPCGFHPRVVGPTINSLERAKPHVQSRHLPYLRQGQLHRMRSTRRPGAGRCAAATAMQLRTQRPFHRRRIDAVAAVRSLTDRERTTSTSETRTADVADRAGRAYCQESGAAPCCSKEVGAAPISPLRTE